MEINIQRDSGKAKSESSHSLHQSDLLYQTSIPAILSNLNSRYERGNLYTYNGDSLIYYHKNKKKKLNGDENLSMIFRSPSDCSISPPHLFHFCRYVYQNLLLSNHSHSLFLRGENCIEKSETYNRILRFYSRFQSKKSLKPSSANMNVSSLLLDSQAFLSGFNENIVGDKNMANILYVRKLFFDTTGVLVSTSIRHWVFETPIRSATGYSNLINYSIFRSLIADTTNEEKKLYKIPESSTSILPPSNSGVNYFKLLKEGLKVYEFTEQQITELITILSAILHLNNLNFKTMDQSNNSVIITNPSVLSSISDILRIKVEDLQEFLLHKLIFKSVYNQPSDFNSSMNRNILMITLYTLTLNAITQRINAFFEEIHIHSSVVDSSSSSSFANDHHSSTSTSNPHDDKFIAIFDFPTHFEFNFFSFDDDDEENDIHYDDEDDDDVNHPHPQNKKNDDDNKQKKREEYIREFIYSNENNIYHYLFHYFNMKVNEFSNAGITRSAPPSFFSSSNPIFRFISPPPSCNHNNNMNDNKNDSQIQCEEKAETELQISDHRKFKYNMKFWEPHLGLDLLFEQIQPLLSPLLHHHQSLQSLFTFDSSSTSKIIEISEFLTDLFQHSYFLSVFCILRTSRHSSAPSLLSTSPRSHLQPPQHQLRSDHNPPNHPHNYNNNNMTDTEDDIDDHQSGNNQNLRYQIEIFNIFQSNETIKANYPTIQTILEFTQKFAVLGKQSTLEISKRGVIKLIHSADSSSTSDDSLHSQSSDNTEDYLIGPASVCLRHETNLEMEYLLERELKSSILLRSNPSKIAKAKKFKRPPSFHLEKPILEKEKTVTAGTRKSTSDANNKIISTNSGDYADKKEKKKKSLFSRKDKSDVQKKKKELKQSNSASYSNYFSSSSSSSSTDPIAIPSHDTSNNTPFTATLSGGVGGGPGLSLELHSVKATNSGEGSSPSNPSHMMNENIFSSPRRGRSISIKNLVKNMNTSVGFLKPKGDDEISGSNSPRTFSNPSVNNPNSSDSSSSSPKSYLLNTLNNSSGSGGGSGGNNKLSLDLNLSDLPKDDSHRVGSSKLGNSGGYKGAYDVSSSSNNSSSYFTPRLLHSLTHQHDIINPSNQSSNNNGNNNSSSSNNSSSGGSGSGDPYKNPLLSHRYRNRTNNQHAGGRDVNAPHSPVDVSTYYAKYYSLNMEDIFVLSDDDDDEGSNHNGGGGFDDDSSVSSLSDFDSDLESSLDFELLGDFVSELSSSTLPLLPTSTYESSPSLSDNNDIDLSQAEAGLIALLASSSDSSKVDPSDHNPSTSTPRSGSGEEKVEAADNNNNDDGKVTSSSEIGKHQRDEMRKKWFGRFFEEFVMRANPQYISLAHRMLTLYIQNNIRYKLNNLNKYSKPKTSSFQRGHHRRTSSSSSSSSNADASSSSSHPLSRQSKAASPPSSSSPTKYSGDRAKAEEDFIAFYESGYLRLLFRSKNDMLKSPRNYKMFSPSSSNNNNNNGGGGNNITLLKSTSDTSSSRAAKFKLAAQSSASASASKLSSQPGHSSISSLSGFPKVKKANSDNSVEENNAIGHHNNNSGNGGNGGNGSNPSPPKPNASPRGKGGNNADQHHQIQIEGDGDEDGGDDEFDADEEEENEIESIASPRHQLKNNFDLISKVANSKRQTLKLKINAMQNILSIDRIVNELNFCNPITSSPRTSSSFSMNTISEIEKNVMEERELSRGALSINFLDYAKYHFNIPKKYLKLKQSSSKFKSKLKKTVSFTKAEMTESLHRLSGSKAEIAVATFKHILAYITSDQPPSPSPGDASSLSTYNILNHAEIIIQNGLENSALRDEIFCQLIKQTINNSNLKYLTRAWELLAFCVGCFAPTSLFIKYLVKYFDDVILFSNNLKATSGSGSAGKSIKKSLSTGDSSGSTAGSSSYDNLYFLNLNNLSSKDFEVFASWAVFCKDRLDKTLRYNKRLFVPTLTELSAVKNKKPIIQTFYFMDGRQKQVPIYSSTTADEVLQFLMVMIGLKNVEGYMIYESFSVLHLDENENEDAIEIDKLKHHLHTVEEISDHRYELTERSLSAFELLCNSLSKFEEFKNYYKEMGTKIKVECKFVVKRKLFFNLRNFFSDFKINFENEISLLLFQVVNDIKNERIIISEDDAIILSALILFIKHGPYVPSDHLPLSTILPDRILTRKAEKLWISLISEKYKLISELSHSSIDDHHNNNNNNNNTSNININDNAKNVDDCKKLVFLYLRNNPFFGSQSFYVCYNIPLNFHSSDHHHHHHHSENHDGEKFGDDNNNNRCYHSSSDLPVYYNYASNYSNLFLDWKLDRNIIMTINENGIFLFSTSRSLLYYISYLEILRPLCDPNSITLSFFKGKTLVLETEKGDEIVSLIIDYKYHQLKKYK